MDIRDFIINEEEIAKEKEKKASAAKKTIAYSVEIASGCDLVIKKETKCVKTTEQILALLLSKDLFYIKSGKTMKQITPGLLKNFFKDLEKPLHIEGCNWTKRITNNEDWNLLCRDLSSKDVTELARHGFYKGFQEYKNNDSLLMLDLKIDLYNISPTFLKWIMDNIETENRKITPTTYSTAGELFKENPVIAKYFLLQCMKSSLDSISISKNFLLNIKEYNLDYKTAIDYVLFGLYKQGASAVSDFNGILRIWYDYLRLAKRNGKVKVKYPKSVNIAHDLAYRDLDNSRNINESLFKEAIRDYKSYEFKTADFLIKLPESPYDLMDEGNALGHCIATYIPKVQNRECVIFLMRKREEPDVPYLTVELIGNNVYEIEGDNKRFDLTPEEKNFIKAWAEKNDLDLEMNNNFYDKYAC